MTTATYAFEVQWDGVSWTDETVYLLSCEWRRGRDYASQLTGRASAGSLVAQLRNPDGRFASLNAASPLTGNVLPARKVRMRSTAPTAATLWQGFLDELKPQPSAGSAPTALLRAFGPLGWIARRQAATAVFTALTTGTAVEKVLDDAGWPVADRTLDTGQITMNRWAADGEGALVHLREVEETEFGFVSESRDGKIVFEDVHHRLKTPHTTPQATFSDAAAAALPYQSLEQLDPWREIFNRFEADVTLFGVQALATLWSLTGEVPSIEPGVTRDFYARFPSPDSATQADHVDAWTTPVATTDYVANSASDGSGTNLTASITVVVVKAARSMKISLANAASVTAYITLLQARGTPAYRNDPIGVAVEDSASQAKYGKRTFPLGGKFYPSTAKALSYAQFGVSRYKDPLAVLSITFVANERAALMTEALTRGVSDRITVIANNTAAQGAQLGINRDFWIEAEHHRVEQGGLRHTVRYDLSDANLEGGMWVLGVSTLGVTTRLCP